MLIIYMYYYDMSNQIEVTAHYPLRSHELAQLSEIVLGLFPPEREADGEDRFHGLCTIL